MKKIGYGVLGLLAFSISSATAVMPSTPQYTFESLYSFCSVDRCNDGMHAASTLLQDGSGDLFGVTSQGGENGQGVVFELVPNVKKTRWKFHLLYDFCAKANCTDGAVPVGALILDVSGNLYGTTAQGGKSNAGTAFELSPSESGKKWHLRVLHDFFVLSWDGSIPEGVLDYSGKSNGAAYDGISPLYGTTLSGGAQESGTAFELLPPQGKPAWAEKIIYNFCHSDECIDGELPNAGLVMDASGNLFGTTGGSFPVVFELSSAGRKKVWNYTILHSFLNSEGGPSAPAIDATGNLFGTLSNGFGGEIFKIVPSGESSQYSVLYSFCSQQGCADGTFPIAELNVDPAGNLFGTTSKGGANNQGVVFEFDQTLHVLHDFAGADGDQTRLGLILDTAGDLFGATSAGGLHDDAGSLFELERQ